jgi:hypothetical protein
MKAKFILCNDVLIRIKIQLLNLAFRQRNLMV